MHVESLILSITYYVEFGEELVLQRTPQTLTLVGELEENNEDEGDLSHDDDESSSEEVEVLLSFEHRGKEYNLVRLLDPILLVGKADDSMPGNRVLLSPEEADAVMPVLVRITVVGAILCLIVLTNQTAIIFSRKICFSSSMMDLTGYCKNEATRVETTDCDI